MTATAAPEATAIMDDVVIELISIISVESGVRGDCPVASFGDFLAGAVFGLLRFLLFSFFSFLYESLSDNTATVERMHFPRFEKDVAIICRQKSFPLILQYI